MRTRPPGSYLSTHQCVRSASSQRYHINHPLPSFPANVVADVLLIFVPVRLLARTTLERGLKIRLAFIFSATILTMVVGLVHATYLLEAREIDAIISAVVETAVCLIVCDLVVVVPAVYRACGGPPDNGTCARASNQSHKLSSLRFGAGESGTERTLSGETGARDLESGMERGVEGPGVSAKMAGEGIEIDESGDVEMSSLEAKVGRECVRCIQEEQSQESN